MGKRMRWEYLKSAREVLKKDLKKGRQIASLFPCVLGAELMHAYFDLSRLGLFRLRHTYLEHAVFVGGFDAILFHGLRQ
jgi:hypothetical protein